MPAQLARNRLRATACVYTINPAALAGLGTYWISNSGRVVSLTDSQFASLTTSTELDQLTARAQRLAGQPSRCLLGITGPPGAGKTTLALALVAALGDQACLVGMDGFHLSQELLTELRRLDRKGAIDTFDGPGFLTLIRRLREPATDVVYAPQFRREIEESIAGAVAVGPDVRLVVVEGNYLLVPEAPWSGLRKLLDEVWYCEPPEPMRIASLVARHRLYGRSEEDARDWALGPDQRNAELVATTRQYADLVVTLDHGEPLDPTT